MIQRVTPRERRCLLAITGAFHTDGGIAEVNRLVIHAIAEVGCQLDIFSLLEKDQTVDTRYLSPNAQVHYRAFWGNKVSFTFAVWRTILQGSFANVFVDHVNLASMLAPLALLRRCRYVVWLFGIEVFSPLPDWEGRLGMKHAWKRLAISEFTRSRVDSRFPGLPIHVCDLALDPVRHFASLPSEPVGPSTLVELDAIDGTRRAIGAQSILHVGRMVSGKRFKGQESLLRAFPHIQAQVPQAQLVLVGQGPDHPRLLELARLLPQEVQRAVFMPGFLPDKILDDVYRSCYVFAMPSIGEGFGLVYLEAMSRGKPCLGANLDATPYLVQEGITGLLVDDPRSPEQVAEKILWLLAHPEVARTMGLSGYQRVRSFYLFSHFQERFWNALTAV